jgi:HEAT repeat protein
MTALLATRDVDLRAVALDVLSAVGNGDTVPHLVRLFVREPGDRARVAFVLEALLARGTAPLLAETLESTAEPEVRRALAKALGTLRDPASLEALVRALQKETDDLARVRLLEALGRLGEKRALASVMRLVDDGAVTRQPMQVSSIWVFPWNARVGDVAVWAAASLVEGTPPFALEGLSAFPEPPPSAQVEAVRARVKAFWAEHAGEARYRLGD